MMGVITAAVDGALAGWGLGQKWDADQRAQALGIAAGLLLPLMLKKRAVQAVAALALAAAGYAVHQMMLEKDHHRMFAAPIEAAQDDVSAQPGMN